MANDKKQFTAPLELKQSAQDLRMYLPHADSWTAEIKKDGIREYCHYKAPGEDFFHLLLQGEIFLIFGDSRMCLNCAFRQGVITQDRLYWQRGVRRNRDPLV